MLTVTVDTALPLTLSDTWMPRRMNTLLRDMLLVGGASALIAICAQVSISLAWTPVPLTGQTFGVLLAGVLLGGRRGALACTIYLAQGAAGIPVFAGGANGILPFLGPTAGYLLAFPIAAFVVGTLAEKGMDRKPHTALLAMLLGSLLILLLGSLRLGVFFGDLSVAFAKGFAPFVMGEIVKAVAAALLLPTVWRISRR